MLTDANLQLSSAQAFTAQGTYVSTNTIDLGTARDVGEGEDLYAEFDVNTACTSNGSSTVTFQVIGSAAANLGTPTVLASSDAIPLASLIAGYRMSLKLPPLIGSKGFRYLGVQYVVGAADLTAGKFDAAITNGTTDGKKFYASGFSVT